MEKLKKGLVNGFKAFMRAFLRLIFWIYCKIVYRYKVTGKENVPKDEAVIICGNHRSFIDVPFLLLTCPREIRFISKIELRKNLLFRFLFFNFNVIYINREDERDIAPLKESLKELQNKGCIGIFPEGTRNGLEKNHGKMKNGATYMSLKTGAKIVPVGLKGGEKLFQKAYINYGKTIDFKKIYEGKKAKDVEDEATDVLRDEILKLSK